jgi:SsrA-binding protein
MNKITPKIERTIAVNKRAQHDYFIEERFEAGLVLQGWEVKSLRARLVNISEGYVLLKEGEAWLIGTHISRLKTTCAYITTDPTRTRKLLLNKRELNKLYGSVERKGYTLVAIQLYWHRGKVKLELGLAKGKQAHDKRQDSKTKDWQRQRERLLKQKY